jgi:hypothetical protein
MAIWKLLWRYGICYDHLVYFVLIWYIVPVLVSCTNINLATLPTQAASAAQDFLEGILAIHGKTDELILIDSTRFVDLLVDAKQCRNENWRFCLKMSVTLRRRNKMLNGRKACRRRRQGCQISNQKSQFG